MAYGTVVFGDTEYLTIVPFEAEFEGNTNTVKYIAEGQNRVVILCKHCQNFRLEPIVLTSVDELVRYNWITPKET